MSALVLHPQTKESIAAFIATPAHAVLLTGADGIGKGTVATYVAAKLLGLANDTLLEQYPHYKRITPEAKEVVSIETVRSLQQFVHLKTTGQNNIRRIIIVEHTHTMTTEAQNAFLKLLEEPPSDTVIIMTTAHTHDMLPTIRSRVQALTVTPPAKQDLLTYFSEQYSTAQITQAYFLSGGLPGLMTALLADDNSHPLLQSVTQAKQILQQTLFERLITVESLAKDKVGAVLFCEALGRIAEAGIGQASAKHDQKRLRQWHTIRTQTYHAQEAFVANANTKLVLTNLLLHL